MSMTKCQECERFIDSDEDPDCFVEQKPWEDCFRAPKGMRLCQWVTLCEWCRQDDGVLIRHGAKIDADTL